MAAAYSIDDLQVMAARIAHSTYRVKQENIGIDSAIFKFWVQHKDVGTFATEELPVTEDRRARITVTGKILLWTPDETGERVDVL